MIISFIDGYLAVGLIVSLLSVLLVTYQITSPSPDYMWEKYQWYLARNSFGEPYTMLRFAIFVLLFYPMIMGLMAYDAIKFYFCKRGDK